MMMIENIIYGANLDMGRCKAYIIDGSEKYYSINFYLTGSLSVIWEFEDENQARMAMKLINDDIAYSIMNYGIKPFILHDNIISRVEKLEEEKENE